MAIFTDTSPNDSNPKLTAHGYGMRNLFIEGFTQNVTLFFFKSGGTPNMTILVPGASAGGYDEGFVINDAKDMGIYDNLLITKTGGATPLRITLWS